MSYSINYSINSCYSIRLHNPSGGECCSGQKVDVQHHGGNFTLLRCLWGEGTHDEESGLFNSSEKLHGRHFPNLGAPYLPGVNTQWEWESLKCRFPAGFCDGWDLIEVSTGSACIPVVILELGDMRGGFAGRTAVGKRRRRRKTCGHLLWREKKANRKDFAMRRLEEEDSDTGMEVSVQTVTNLSLSVRGNDKKVCILHTWG